MPLQPDNFDPKEAIEAKLLAYLEGELPSADQAEIEKYLQGNPQHQQLITSLSRTRQLMRLLPRESAPPEIAEAFNTQLERGLLLNGDAESGSSFIRRWPQIALVAAMLLLAATLTAVVYFVLPGRAQLDNVAINRNAAPADARATSPTNSPGTAKQLETPKDSVPLADFDNKKPVAEIASDTAGKGVVNHGLDAAVATVPKLARSGEGEVPETGNAALGGGLQNDAPANAIGIAASGSVAGKGGETPLVSSAVAGSSALAIQNQNTDGMIVQRLRALHELDKSGDQSTVYVVVNSADPASATTEMRRYLVSNGLNYAAEPALSESMGRVKGNEVAKGATIDPQQPNQFFNYQNTNQVASQKDQPGNQTLPFANSRQAQNSNDWSFQDRSKQAQAANGEVYLARGLTLQQAKELSKALNRPDAGQTAILYDNTHREELAPAKVAADAERHEAKAGPALVENERDHKAENAEAQPIQNGDRLSVTVDQLGGPGLDKTSVVKVSGDGTITLPMIEPIGVAGQKPEALSKQIAAKYREANLIDNASVSVKRLDGPDAAAAPAPMALRLAVPATTAPTGADGRIAGGASSQPVTDKVDVMMVVVAEPQAVIQAPQIPNAAASTAPAVAPPPIPVPTTIPAAPIPEEPASQPAK